MGAPRGKGPILHLTLAHPIHTGWRVFAGVTVATGSLPVPSVSVMAKAGREELKSNIFDQYHKTFISTKFPISLSSLFPPWFTTRLDSFPLAGLPLIVTQRTRKASCNVPLHGTGGSHGPMLKSPKAFLDISIFFQAERQWGPS